MHRSCFGGRLSLQYLHWLQSQRERDAVVAVVMMLEG